MSSQKDMIFISHASEDNEFTRWLALQLAKEGYGVWCDLTKLLGGEDWPNEINDALQARTQKFLFVLSKSSNQKHDPQGELTAAFNIIKRDKNPNFIVPLKIDDLDIANTDFRLQNVQAIFFNSSWAAGLSQLLDLLERDKITKNASFTPSSVNSWWRGFKAVDNAIRNTPEDLFSSRFRISSYPKSVFFHQVAKFPDVRHSSIPIIPFKQYLLSFAEQDELHAKFNPVEIITSEAVDISSLVDGTSNLVEDSGQGRHLVTRLFNKVLSIGFRSKGLLYFGLAGKKDCFYFSKGILPNGTIIHTGEKKLSPLIKLWGKTLGERWHWALRGWFESAPLWHFNLQYHILVSDASGELRPAPKRVFNRWNNSTWRDRLRAATLHLAAGQEEINISLGGTQHLCLDSTSLMFTSPITFIEPVNDDQGSDSE
jgi:hypothetical protein